MGGATIIVEAKTKGETEKRLEQHKRDAIRMGLVEERLKFIGYDKKAKVWRGSIWLHS